MAAALCAPAGRVGCKLHIVQGTWIKLVGIDVNDIVTVSYFVPFTVRDREQRRDQGGQKRSIWPHIELNLFLPCRSKRRAAYRLSAWIGYMGWEVGGNGLQRAHGGIHATRVEVRALQLDLGREEEQLREATRLTDKRKV